MVLVLCCAFAIPAIVLWWCCLYFISSRRVFGMVSDGFQAQKRGSWIPGKERAERVLANAISIEILFRVECVDEVALQAMLR